MKQKHLTKEEILAQKESKRLAEQRMKFINEFFMPAMEAETNSLEEAQMLVETVRAFIDNGAKQKLFEMKISDLGLEAMIEKAKHPELLQKHLRILKVLADQTISDGIKLCDGLFTEVNRTLVDELKTRKLSDFKK